VHDDDARRELLLERPLERTGRVGRRERILLAVERACSPKIGTAAIGVPSVPSTRIR